MLSRVVSRVQGASSVDEVVVATTSSGIDDAIYSLCLSSGIPCIRGSEEDVLGRYVDAATEYAAEAVVRVTSDCPLIDPDVIDLVVRSLGAPDAVDYAANIIAPRTFPRGLDVEVLTMPTLERLDMLADSPSLREHVTLYVHQHPEAFRTRAVRADTDLSPLRWTVDTHEDYELVSRIYGELGPSQFAYRDVLDVLAEHPDWSTLNAHVEQKVV